MLWLMQPSVVFLSQQLIFHVKPLTCFPLEKDAVTLTYGAVGSSPARQTFTVAVPVVACGVVGTGNTHLRTQFAIVASWTHCRTHNVMYETTAPDCIERRRCLCLCTWVCNADLDHSWLQCIQVGNHTLLSHGGSGTTGRRTGMTCCTALRTYQLCTLGDKEIKSEPSQMLHTNSSTLLVLMAADSLFWHVTPQ